MKKATIRLGVIVGFTIKKPIINGMYLIIFLNVSETKVRSKALNISILIKYIQ